MAPELFMSRLNPSMVGGFLKIVAISPMSVVCFWETALRASGICDSLKLLSSSDIANRIFTMHLLHLCLV